MKIDEHKKKGKSGDAAMNPARDRNKGMYRGGGREEACHHGLLERLVRPKILRVELQRKDDDEIQIRNK